VTIPRRSLRRFSLFLAPALLLAAGCGSGLVTAKSASSAFFVTPGIGSIDTSCTGCNATSAQGSPVHQFTATLAGGGTAEVSWSIQGRDATSGPGSINSSGQYTPPSYLTADRAEIVVTATLNANPALRASSVLTVTPGFLQPLTPENAALGANGSLTITGFLAEAGGTTGINFKLANSPTGESGGQGTLGAVSCQRGGQTFTTCTVTYSAPASVQATGPTYVVATVGGTSTTSRVASVVLVNSAGVSSNPATHQAQFPVSVALGSSGGNNSDYDTRGEQIVDCCSGTLGALVEDASKRQYLLSNNHVLAKSDHASVGDAIIQPGLIDNNCSPLGDSSSVQPVAALTGWLPLSSRLTNADAAIAQLTSRAVDTSGKILELGSKQADGTLAAAPPGISSTGGKGETGTLDLKVAKSGRTTGLTCGGISAVDLDVRVDYFLDCAETKPYLTKTFTHQLGLSGNQFSDAGDSGALIVDAANAEPVGLYFAGGTDVSGVSQGVANPAPEVLNELSAQLGGGSYTFVGAADHAVSCLSYGNNTVASAQNHPLSNAEYARSLQGMAQARTFVNSSAGVLGVAAGKSSDHPGEAAVILYTDENRTVNVPTTIDGVRTVAIPTTTRAVVFGSAPQTPEAGAASPAASVIAQAVAIKNQVSAGLMRQNPAFFGVGVGQSLDNPREAALIIYVDRNPLPAKLPAIIDGLRTRYIVMDRLHVTRSYATPLPSRIHCMAHTPTRIDSLGPVRPLNLNLK
jgi:hypothetical protein